ncbi:MAG TPA: hypothetical protein VFN10_06425 [Thermoanaerobaculia bacterium]|nr:hypothetical protein [Thermoanaerobaculia bacterium]
MADLTTRIWFSNGSSYSWPEQQAGVGTALGICFPGGGTRAMCAAMGQLRGMISASILNSNANNPNYISCVSGGSWAAAAFAYYDDSITDTDFLGNVIDPAAITASGLDVLPSTSLGSGATMNLGDALDAAHKAGVANDLLWAAAVGSVFFARYNLYTQGSPAYFSLDQDTVAAIVNNNAALSGATFHTVRQPSGYNMPYLLINATIDGPSDQSPYDPDPLVMVTYSPLYCGIPFQQTVSYTLKNGGGVMREALVGGGFIEPFAWGSDAPAASGATNGMVQVPPPTVPFELVNASGTSSSAFAEKFEMIKALDGLLPVENYWPPQSSGGQTAAQLFDFGDGGNLENYGLIPLIMRGVAKVILFVNTSSPLSTTYNPSTDAASSSVIDPNLPVLFGVPVTDGNAAATVNQVFNTSDYATLVAALQTQKNAGEAMIVSMTHDIVQNNWWGIPGGGSIEILWVYLDRVKAWEDQLTDDYIKAQLLLADAGLGDFPHFPNYATVDEDKISPDSLTELSARQVNLLADLTCWVVSNYSSTFTNFISS